MSRAARDALYQSLIKVIMTANNNISGNPDRTRLTLLLEQLRRLSLPDSSTADRFERGQVLDELQDVVGLSGKMVTESDIVRRAEKLAAG
jgi:hypothetical protein